MSLTVQVQNLVQPQAGRVGDLHRRPLPQTLRCLEQPPHLVATQHHRKPLRKPLVGRAEPPPARHHLRVEELDRAQRLVHRRARPTTARQVRDVLERLFLAQLICRCVAESHEPPHPAQVGFPRPRREPPRQHPRLHRIAMASHLILLVTLTRRMIRGDASL